MTESLIIFTRYPEPGKTKTRLIPALGADGATKLHRQMAEYTLAEARKIQALRNISVQVHFTGGDRLLMQDWLGDGIVYQPQANGDLGSRMIQAFGQAISNDIDSAVIIGTDCPSLNAQIIEQAFAQLSLNDLVVGPATDGGYYLIGLQRLIPELFQEINWSTSKVLQQTVNIAENLGLAIAYLPTLSDIDLPEDLANLNLTSTTIYLKP